MAHPRATARRPQVRELTRLRGERHLWLAGLMLVAYVAVVLPSLGQTLLDSHAHRQTQTAYTAVLFASRGFDLLRPPLPVLGPPGVLPLEFPLFQAAGGVLIWLGIEADTAMRITGVICFLLSSAAVYALARRLLSPVAALIALAAYVFNPHSLLYGRASLIEYLAAAASIGMVVFALRYMDGRGSSSWVAAAVLGSVGILVKITTAGVYLVPLLLWRGADRRWGFQRPSVWVLLVAVVAIGLAWSAHAQAVRAEQPAASFLAFQNQIAWFFGTVAQRLDPDRWRFILVAVLSITGSGVVGWAVLAYRQSRQQAQAPFLLSLLALPVVVPLVLFNLFSEHDYYWIAVAPPVAVAVGLGVEWIAERIRTRRARRTAVVLVGAWLATIVGLSGTWTMMYGQPVEEARAFRIAGFLRDHSAPSDWVVLTGLDWNTTYLYYARRQGLAVPTGDDDLQDVAAIDFPTMLADPRLGPFIACDIEGSCEVSERP